MRVRILSGNQTGLIADLPRHDAEAAVSSGFAELVGTEPEALPPPPAAADPEPPATAAPAPEPAPEPDPAPEPAAPADDEAPPPPPTKHGRRRHAK